MYPTIEAEIENGVIKGCDVSRIPPHAQVLITLLRGAQNKRPEFGTKTSAKILATPDAFMALSDQEITEWGL